MTEKLKNRKAEQSSIPMGAELPLKPLALMNVKQIDVQRDNVQRDAHDFMRCLFYFLSFAEIADIYFV